ncbi:MAG TPA: FAD-binding protein [Puia sp.]
MSKNPRITPTNLKVYTNRHDTFNQPIDNLFDISNGNTGNVLDDYNATTAAVQDFLSQAIQSNKRVRCLGGGWSFTKVAATEGWILNTKALNMIITISGVSIAPQYTGDKDQLLFVQCGNSIQELDDYTQANQKSLKTQAASNGQTLIGAISTSTHGASIDVGGIQDYVVGLHIIVSPDKHIWLERASHPVVSDAFIAKLQTVLIRDDELFNAALVSFGSFGFIHGAMIETEPIYLLEGYRILVPYDDKMKQVMTTLDFSNASFLPYGSERPFHFQVVVNQYDIPAGAYLTVMYKRPYTADHQPPVRDLSKAGPGDDVPSFLGKFTDLLPSVTPFIVSKLVKSQYSLYSKLFGTLGEIFTNSEVRGRVASAAVGFPLSYVARVNDLLIRLNGSDGPFVGIFSYRYVKGSKATLAFTKFDYTCVMELDAVMSNETDRFYAAVWKEMDAANIPYTFHWGKINNLANADLSKMYGPGRASWIKARNTLLPPVSLTLFNNQLLSDWGLDGSV